jgi:hypothetical protein
LAFDLPADAQQSGQHTLGLGSRSEVEVFNAMPWDESYYPKSMRNLPPEVRLKAIEIANALLEEGYDEGKAIRIAIAKAKQWASREWNPR